MDLIDKKIKEMIDHSRICPDCGGKQIIVGVNNKTDTNWTDYQCTECKVFANKDLWTK